MAPTHHSFNDNKKVLMKIHQRQIICVEDWTPQVNHPQTHANTSTLPLYTFLIKYSVCEKTMNSIIIFLALLSIFRGKGLAGLVDKLHKLRHHHFKRNSTVHVA
jgi:hypothetical protein